KLFGACEQPLCNVDHLDFGQRLANRVTLRSKESVRDTAADDELVDFGQQRLENRELRGHFRACHDRDQWTLRLLERDLERLELVHEQRTRACNRCKTRNAVRARLGAMRRT